MEFTGERMVLGQTDIELEIEHINRYYFAKQFVEGKKVLDAACGTGYGSAILAQQANKVIGIDISEEAIEYATDKYGSEKIAFINASIDSLPFEDQSFDVVVSFETLEHVDEKAQYHFIKEIKRVLATDGILVISTPNHDVYKKKGENHYHIRELSLSELKILLGNKFKNVSLLSQQFEVCNTIVGPNSALAESINGLQPENTEYLIAVCGDEWLPHIEHKIYIRTDNKFNNLMEWAISTHNLNEKSNNAVKALEGKLAVLEGNKNELNQRILKYLERIDNLTIKAHHLENVEKSLRKIFERIDIELQHKENELKQKHNEICQRDEIIQKIENHNIELQQIIKNKEGHINLLLESDRELQIIKSTRTWRMISFFKRILNGIFPEGSKRRLFAKLIKKFVRHPIGFIKKINPNLVKKFFTILKREGASGVSYRMDNALGGAEIQSSTVKIEKIIAKNKDITEYKPLMVKAEANPLVSIIIPVYNQFEYTYNCIKSILLHSREVSFEIIIANDCSTDLTTKIEQVVSNIQVINNEQNLRFLKNCNNAAKYAKGKYILFLNNDTQVQENWLAPLIELIEQDTSIGLVGSKLVYANGKLQEAGGIFWNDASAWNYGNKSDPNEPEYNYVKEVDYISGACIMISKQLWNEIGGFDERYAPAYYEDSDLAFEVRKRGYKVVYQPKSVVIHFEGVSNGTDINTGQKAYQITNKKKFFKKWKDVLSKEHFQNGENVFIARDRSAGKKHVLVVDHYVPHHDKDAGGKCTYMYIKLFLKLGLHVTFIGDNFYRHEPYTTELQQMGVDVLYGNYYYTNWKKWLKENGHYFDYAYLNRPHISIKYIDLIKEYSNAKIIYFGHDLHYLREQRAYEITGDKKLLMSSKEWKKKEFELFKKADTVYVVGSYEQNLLKKVFVDKPIRNIPVYFYNSIQNRDQIDFSKRHDIIFVGGFGHAPNTDAVLWFAKEIFPKILKTYPNLKWYIVGSKPPKEIQALASNNIIVTGFISDEELSRLYLSCRMSVVPLRYGAGVKGKVIESIYNRIPLITTAIGAEGLSLKEKAFIVADSAEEFAQQITDGYNDFHKLEDLAARSVEFIENYFTTDVAQRIVEKDIVIN